MYHSVGRGHAWYRIAKWMSDLALGAWRMEWNVHSDSEQLLWLMLCQLVHPSCPGPAFAESQTCGSALESLTWATH